LENEKVPWYNIGNEKARVGHNYCDAFDIRGWGGCFWFWQNFVHGDLFGGYL
jgi:hypothetical protein